MTRAKVASVCVYTPLPQGTSLLWPRDETPYTFGVINVLDVSTVAIFYGAWTAAREELVQPGVDLAAFCVVLTLWML